MEKHTITMTHLNIRQSIVFLLAKLIVTDILLAIIIIGFYLILIWVENSSGTSFDSMFLFPIAFSINGLLKILLSVYIVLQWLNEYYEITPEYIYHKKGIIFRKVEEFRVDQIRRIDVQDSFLGELFNFATISIYDTRLNKTLDLYLIHNPKRYVQVLKELKPDLEEEEDNISLGVLPND